MSERVKIVDASTGLDFGGANPFRTVQAGGGLPVDSKGVVATPGKQSTNVANAVASASTGSAVGKTSYLTGLTVTGSGATVGTTVQVTITGLLGGSISYNYTAETGADKGNRPLNINFIPPLPASGPGTGILATCPALGAGNLANMVTITGFIL